MNFQENLLFPRLLRCFSAVFPSVPVDAEVEVENLVVEKMPEWDSLTNVMLLSVVQEEFSVNFDARDLPNLASFKAILSRLEKLSDS